MRKKSLSIFFIALAAFVFFVWLIWNKNFYNSSEAFTYAFPVQTQPQKQRKWRNLNFDFTARSPELLRPLYMQSGPQNTFYVTDYGDLKVKKFDLNGSPIKNFGKGRGKGPGEIAGLIWSAVDSTGSVWVADYKSSKITIFKADTFDIIQTSRIPDRIVPIGTKRYLFQTRFNSQPVLKNCQDSTLLSFDPIVRHPDSWPYVLTGWFANDGKGGIIRVNTYTNDIIRYHANGAILYFRRSVMPSPLPEYRPPQENSLNVTFHQIDYNTIKQLSLDFSVISNQIHILISDHRADSDSTQPTFIDVYSLQKGDYLYSYRLPVPLRDIAISQSYIAGIPRDSAYFNIWKNRGGWRQ